MDVHVEPDPQPAAAEGDVIVPVTVVTTAPDSSANDSVQQLRAEMTAGFTELKDMIVGAAAVTVAAVAETAPAESGEVDTIEAAPAESPTPETPADELPAEVDAGAGKPRHRWI